MDFNPTNVNNMPMEIILLIFSKMTDVNVVCKFAYSHDYVFNIYKNKLDQIINQLIDNNKVSELINYVIMGCYNKKDSIEKKLDNIKLVADFLSKNNNKQLNSQYNLVLSYNRFNRTTIDIGTQMSKYYNMLVIESFPHKIAQFGSSLDGNQYNIFIDLIKLGYNSNESHWIATQLNQEQINIMNQIMDNGIDLHNAKTLALDIDKNNIDFFLELIRRGFSSCMAKYVIRNLNKSQIEQMNELILKGIDINSAPEIVEIFNDIEIELILEINSINNSESLLTDIITNQRNETDLLVMLELVKNNFDIEQVGFLTSRLVDMDNFNNNQIIKCIKLKNNGIYEGKIVELFEREMFEDFNFKYYNSLMEKINDSNTVMDIIIHQIDDDKINKIIEIVNENIPAKYAYDLVKYSKEVILNIKPYLEYIKMDSIHLFVNNFNEINNYIKIFQETNLNIKNIIELVFYPYVYKTIDFTFISDIIKIVKQLKENQLDDSLIVRFIISYSNYYSVLIKSTNPHLNIPNIYELPHLRVYIWLLIKGFKYVDVLTHIVEMISNNGINIKYINDLNDEDLNYVKTFDETKMTIFLNLCEETKSSANHLRLMKSLSEDALSKIHNLVLNTGKIYLYSIKYLGY